MSIPVGTLAFFRTEWDTRFTDSCIVKEETGKTLNQTSGQYEPTYATQYDGPCLVRPASDADRVYGEQLAVIFDHVVFIPWDQVDPKVNHLVDITSATDPKLDGKTMLVRGIPTDTYVTKRMLLCQDRQAA